MSDTYNANPLSFLINQNDPNVNMQLRQRLALAMLARNKSAAPKNIGEGIHSFANSISDAMLERSILGQDVAAQAAGKQASADTTSMLPPPIGTPTAPPAPAPVAPPPQPSTPPPPQARSFAPTGPQASAPAAPVSQPSMMAMAPSQPDQILGPDPTASTPPPQPQQPPPQPASMITAPPMGQPRGDGTVDPNAVNAIDAQANDPWAARSRSIAGIESGGAKDPYATLGAQTRTGDRAIGKYQIMGANVPSWTEAALGKRMTPEQFRNDSAAQEAVFKHRFGGYVDKYGEAGAAKAWYAGEKGMQNPNATDLHGRLTVADYGNDYLRRLGMPDPGPRDRIAAAMPPAGPAQPSGGAQAISPPPTALTDPNAPAGSGGLPPVITDGPGSRGSIANTMVAQAQPPAPPPPQAGGATAQPPAQTGIQKAPEAAVPGYITSDPAQLPERSRVPIGPQELELTRRLQDAQRRGSTYEIAPLEYAIKQWQDHRAHLQTNIDNADKRAAEMAKDRALEAERSRQTATGRIDTHEQTQEEIKRARNENALRAQFGNLPPTEVFKRLDDSRKMASAGADGLKASSAAMDAFAKGAITGSKADMRLNMSKLVTMMGFADKGDIISNTETFRNAMSPVVASIMHQTSGTSQLSEGELAFAKAAAAGNIELDAKSIQRLVSIIDKRSREVLGEHQTLTGALFGNEPKAKAVYGVDTPDVPHNFASDADAAAAKLKPGTRVRINGRLGTVE